MADRSVRRVGLLAFLAYFLLGGAWALALPYNGNADESEHIVRAYGVATGQVLAAPAVLPDGHPGAYFDVPRSLAPENPYCMYFEYRSGFNKTRGTKLAADCLRLAPDDRTSIRRWSWVGRYHPAYYAVVGAPLRLMPDMRGVIAARLLTALGCALLVAVAVVAAWLTRRPLMVLAVILAATPSVVGLGGSVNPGGLEVAAGIALWPALLLLLTGGTERRVLWLAAASAALLTSLRGLGGLLLALGVGSVALAVGVGPVRDAVRDRRWRGPVLFVAFAGVSATVWNVVSGNFVWHRYIGAVKLNYIEASKYELQYRIDQWLRQVVGQFGWGDTFLPLWSIGVWYVLMALLVIPAALAAERRRAVLIAGIPLVALAMLIGFELRYLHLLGWAQYGRYVMPFAVAVLMVAALGRYPAPAAVVSRFVRLAVLAAAACQSFALPVVMTRFQHGPSARLGPLSGAWLPDSGPVVPLLLGLVGAGLLITFGWTAARMPEPDVRPAPRQPAEREPVAASA